MYFIDQLVPTGNINTVGAPIRQNVDKSYRAGAELEWNYCFSKKLSFYMNQYLAANRILDYTNYLIAYNESDYSVNASASEQINYTSTSIAFSPSWIFYAELKYSPWSHTHLRLMNKIVSAQFLDNTSSVAKSIPFIRLQIYHCLIP